jgi:hypothetical protein
MTTLVLRFSRLIAAALVLLVAAQMSEAAALPIQELQQQTAPPQPATPAPAPRADTQVAQTAELPESPVPAQRNTAQPAPELVSSSSQDAQQPDAQKPVGTAAGPSTRPVGVAGSRPSGAAIAPAKQRRVKAILIRISLIAAGAAAVGAVVGLSKESPSKP